MSWFQASETRGGDLRLVEHARVAVRDVKSSQRLHIDESLQCVYGGRLGWQEWRRQVQQVVLLESA